MSQAGVAPGRRRRARCSAVGAGAADGWRGPGTAGVPPEDLATLGRRGRAGRAQQARGGGWNGATRSARPSPTLPTLSEMHSTS